MGRWDGRLATRRGRVRTHAALRYHALRCRKTLFLPCTHPHTLTLLHILSHCCRWRTFPHSHGDSGHFGLLAIQVWFLLPPTTDIFARTQQPQPFACGMFNNLNCGSSSMLPKTCACSDMSLLNQLLAKLHSACLHEKGPDMLLCWCACDMVTDVVCGVAKGDMGKRQTAHDMLTHTPFYYTHSLPYIYQQHAALSCHTHPPLFCFSSRAYFGALGLGSSIHCVAGDTPPPPPLRAYCYLRW